MRPENACKECGKRWIQANGLCRRCNRLKGDTRSTQDMERERIERQREHFVALRAAEQAAPPPPRTVVDEGIEFEIVWPR